MKVMLVNGSPHKEGCTYTALSEVGKHKCVLADAVNQFLDVAGDYDGFVFGPPVHWGGASGGMTSFMDRAFYAGLCGGGERFLLKPAAVGTADPARVTIIPMQDTAITIQSGIDGRTICDGSQHFTGYVGAQFPWESAWLDDGEVTPEYMGTDIVTNQPPGAGE